MKVLQEVYGVLPVSLSQVNHTWQPPSRLRNAGGYYDYARAGGTRVCEEV